MLKHSKFFPKLKFVPLSTLLLLKKLTIAIEDKLAGERLTLNTRHFSSFSKPDHKEKIAFMNLPNGRISFIGMKAKKMGNKDFFITSRPSEA